MDRQYGISPVLTPGDIANESQQLQSPNGGFSESVTEGALSSFGLGTAVRDVAIPSGNPSFHDIVSSDPLTFGIRAAQSLGRMFQPAPPPMSQSEYQNSQYFRQNIPWDQAMTQDRAAALATFYDASQVRQQRLAQTPGWASKVLGSVVGQALDPINYIPFLGEAAQAAAVGKMGVIAGHMVTAGADAALNTGVSAVLTAPTRAQYGDDVSFQSTMLDIASAAVIGAAFGGVGGVLAGRRITRERAALRNITDTHAALNDAVGSILTDGEVRLRPGSMDGIGRMAAQDAPPARLDTIAGPERAAAEAPEAAAISQLASAPDHSNLQWATEPDGSVNVGAVMRDADPGALTRPDRNVQRTMSQLRDGEDFGVYDLPIRSLIGTQEKVNPDFAASSADRLSSAKPEALPAVYRLDDKLYVADGHHRVVAAYAAGSPTVRARLYDVDAALGKAPIEDTAHPKLDTTVPPPDAAPADLAKAATTASKPSASLKEIADDFRIDPETGDFPELVDYQSLERQGTLTAAEKADFDATTEILDRSKTYADALQQAAICGMN